MRRAVAGADRAVSQIWEAAERAGIRPGAVAPALGMEDVAPLLAHLLGLELPEGDGNLPLGFLAEPEPQR